MFWKQLFIWTCFILALFIATRPADSLASAEFPLASINGSNGFVIRGISAGDQLSRGRGIGDINDDGIDDFAITARLANPGGRTDAGQTYVIFGQTSSLPPVFDLTSMDGSNGFTINGIDPGDGAGGLTAAPAGDVNSDGISDLIIGARTAEPGASERVGEAYVVFGRATPFPAVLELSTLNGSNGFRLFGIDAFDDFGRAAAGAGDFNGDGIDDMVIGAALADPPSRFNGGETYIVFGRSSGFPASLGMATLNGSNGFVMRGETDNDIFGCFVDGAGDVNGDSLGDVVIGACQGNSVRANRVGKTFVIFGSSNPVAATVELSGLIDGTRGIRLRGEYLGGQLGISVAGVGDVNGDGFADVMTGEPQFQAAAPSGSYVVFGSNLAFPATTNLSTLTGQNGVAIPGLGTSAGIVGGGGDTNGDGFADFLVGAPGTPDSVVRRGAAYLVFGKAGGFPSSIDVTLLDGSDGIRFTGIAPGDGAGNSVSIIGDWNQDGLDDIVVGAPNAASLAGEIYVIFGFNGASEPPTAVAGPDQSIRANETVNLDGTASFDDNTLSQLLMYEWTFFSRPSASTAVLAGADTATPSFTADVADTYIVELVVTDEDGLQSEPDQVVISSDNLAPTAEAGSVQLVVVGAVVNLNGGNSSDPEGETLTYSWVIDGSPTGSTATLTGPNTIAPSFVPDVEGVYTIKLSVSDSIGPGVPDFVDVTAATPENFAIAQILAANAIVAALTPAQVTTVGNQNAFQNFLGQAIVALQSSSAPQAVKKVEDAIERTNGCPLRGSPDGNGPGKDWITDCTAQLELYDLLTSALAALQS